MTGSFSKRELVKINVTPVSLGNVWIALVPPAGACPSSMPGSRKHSGMPISDEGSCVCVVSPHVTEPTRNPQRAEVIWWLAWKHLCVPAEELEAGSYELV